jgi:hypothetical protein
MKLIMRRALIGGVVAAAAAFLLAFAAGASTPPGTQFLPGDNFEIDGNKAVSTAGNTDWANAPNLVTDPDLAKSTSDNSLGQGSKENTAVPSVVSGSIPPNKSDFSEFQESHRVAANGDTLLYLDWTRTNVLGSADMDFELNQSGVASSNGVTPKRTQGDLLITYDFANGGNSVSIHTATWNGNDTSGSWSVLTSLNSNAAVASIADSLLFGELAIDLNTAGIFQRGSCQSFSQAYLKSRASDSFTSELKDFVAPRPVNITNCGRIVVNKVDANTGQPVAGATFSVSPGKVVNGTQQSSSSLTEVSAGVFCIDNMLLGQTYTVTETAPPPAYNLPGQTSQQTSVNNTSTCGDTISGADLTFRDPPVRGAILVQKSAKDHNSQSGSSPLAGAIFELRDSNGNAIGSQQMTLADGTACFSNLPIGTYSLHEVSAPPGYDTADDVTGLQISSASTCSSNPVTAPVVDTPLSRIEVIFTSEAGPGVTTGDISCTGLTADNGSTTDDKTFSDLPPGTYNCSVVVDP